MCKKIKKPRIQAAPLYDWSTKEKLSLASSVCRSGDQNWASVIRAIKPFTEDDHPSEWFSQKQCAQQYAALLDKIETPKRKRGERSDADTPGLRIVRRLTIERIDELKQLVQTQQKEYKKMKEEIECIRSGQIDDQLTELLAEIEAEEQEQLVESQTSVTSDTTSLSVTESQDSTADLKILDQSQTSIVEEIVNVENVSEEQTIPVTALPLPPTKSPLKLYIPTGSLSPKPQPGLSPKGLSTQEHVAKIIQEEAEKLKREQFTQALNKSSRTPEKSPVRSAKSSPIILTGVGDIKLSPIILGVTPFGKSSEQAVNIEAENKHTPSPRQPDSTIKTPVKTPVKDNVYISPIKYSPAKNVESPTPSQPSSSIVTELLASSAENLDESIIKNESSQETSVLASSQDNSVTSNPEQVTDTVFDDSSSQQTNTQTTDIGDLSIKQEPSSPSSSVSSSSSKPKGLKSRSETSQSVTKSILIEEKKEKSEIIDKQSEIDSTDDESIKTVDTITLDTVPLEGKGLLALPTTSGDSVPNSPLSQYSDTEEERVHKSWKKSIMLVYRAASLHKYANVFSNRVTNDIAPGYEQIVHRPMDLREIKKNIETGVIRTTAEFQRDLMLMFTNALMYNESDHDVYSMTTLL